MDDWTTIHRPIIPEPLDIGRRFELDTFSSNIEVHQFKPDLGYIEPPKKPFETIGDYQPPISDTSFLNRDNDFKPQIPGIPDYQPPIHLQPVNPVQDTFQRVQAEMRYREELQALDRQRDQIQKRYENEVRNWGNEDRWKTF